MAVERPDAVDDFGDTLRAAEVGAEFEVGWRAEFVMEQVMEPGPAEIRCADGLGFVARGEESDSRSGLLAAGEGDLYEEERLDGREVLRFVDGDAIEAVEVDLLQPQGRRAQAFDSAAG